MSTMFSSTSSSSSSNQTGRNDSFALNLNVTNPWVHSDAQLNDENSAVGILLAAKALVQLIVTPFMTSLINSYGYRIPTAFGTFMLFVASLSMCWCNRWLTHSHSNTVIHTNSVSFVSRGIAFAVGTNYFLLLMARAMQGVASACISVCGMSIIAQVICFCFECHSQKREYKLLNSRLCSFIRKRRNVRKCLALCWAAWRWAFYSVILSAVFCMHSLANRLHSSSSHVSHLSYWCCSSPISICIVRMPK